MGTVFKIFSWLFVALAFSATHCSPVPSTGGIQNFVSNPNPSTTKDDLAEGSLAPPAPRGTPGGETIVFPCLGGELIEDTCLITFKIHTDMPDGNKAPLVQISGKLHVNKILSPIGQPVKKIIPLIHAPIQVYPPGGNSIPIKTNENGCFQAYFFAMPDQEFLFSVEKPNDGTLWYFSDPVSFKKSIPLPEELAPGESPYLPCALSNSVQDQDPTI